MATEQLLVPGPAAFRPEKRSPDFPCARQTPAFSAARQIKAGRYQGDARAKLRHPTVLPKPLLASS
jgi:hypothetical protein